MSEEPETADAINQRASDWVARIDRADLDEAARAELDAWLAGDSRRRGAFLRAQAAWRMLDRVRALPVDAVGFLESDHVDGALPVPSSGRVRRRFVLGGAIALAAGASGVALLPALPFLARDFYRTEIGEVRRLPLADGSLAAINTQSELEVALTDNRRSIRLQKGEAWFQVAKDTERPFVVSAGDVRVQAVGTAFSVRRAGVGIEVQVTEGVVETWTVSDAGRRMRLSAGSRTVIAEDGKAVQPPVEAAVELDRRLAWRSGQLILDGDTLEQAAAEFNRYNERQVVIADPALARERLVGRFRTNEPDSFARAVALTLGARVSASDGEIRITRS